MIYGEAFLNRSSFSFENILLDINERTNIILSLNIDDNIINEALSMEDVKSKIKYLFDKLIDFFRLVKDKISKMFKIFITKMKLKIAEWKHDDDKIKELEEKLRKSTNEKPKVFKYEYKHYITFGDRSDYKKSLFHFNFGERDKWFIKYNNSIFDSLRTEIKNEIRYSYIQYAKNESDVKEAITKMRNEIYKLYYDNINSCIIFENNDLNNMSELISRTDEYIQEKSKPEIEEIIFESKDDFFSFIKRDDEIYEINKIKNNISLLENFYKKVDSEYSNHIRDIGKLKDELIKTASSEKQRNIFSKVADLIIPILTNIDKNIVSVNTKIFNFVLTAFTQQIAEERRFRLAYSDWVEKACEHDDDMGDEEDID